ncbi:MAG: hypothetical protein KIG46_03970, partial [Bacteroidales bacterium]|nr:hypothetical protein [Bacteroidales bacterium]
PFLILPNRPIQTTGRYHLSVYCSVSSIPRHGIKVKPKSYKNAKEVPAERINADLQKTRRL